MTLTLKTVNDLKNKLTFTMYREFISRWIWMSSYLRSTEDFHDITLDVLKTLSSRGVLYVEFNYNYMDSQSLTTYLMTNEIIKACNIAETLYGIKSNLLINFPRNKKTESEFIEVLDTLKPFINIPSSHICGMNLSSKEDPGSSLLYMNLFNHAKSLGLRTTVHTGEDGGIQEIWDAISNLNPDRIGHGVKAYNDKLLMQMIKIKQLPLESCVTSNIKTNTILKPITNHPIRTFFDYGLNVFFNSDDPLYFGNYIDDEMTVLMDKFNFNNNEIEKMFNNALESSFLSESGKKEIRMRCKEICKEEIN